MTNKTGNFVHNNLFGYENMTIIWKCTVYLLFPQITVILSLTAHSPLIIPGTDVYWTGVIWNEAGVALTGRSGQSSVFLESIQRIKYQRFDLKNIKQLVILPQRMYSFIKITES